MRIREGEGLPYKEVSKKGWGKNYIIISKIIQFRLKYELNWMIEENCVSCKAIERYGS